MSILFDDQLKYALLDARTITSCMVGMLLVQELLDQLKFKPYSNIRVIFGTDPHVNDCIRTAFSISAPQLTPVPIDPDPK